MLEKLTLDMLDRFVQDQSEGLNWVTSDNEGGAYALTRHLIDLGHKRIGMVIISPEYQLERISTLMEREQGYLRAIREAGLDSLLLKKCCISDEINAVVGRELMEFIHARRPTLTQRLGKWSRRHRTARTPSP